MTARLAPPVPIAPERARRRWGRWVALLLLLLVIAGVAVLHSSWLSVHQIEILGSEHSDVAARLEQAGIGEGAIMIWVSPGDVEEAVLVDPWVREARVQRVLPGTLVVEVLEHTPAAWIEGRTGWMLVSRDGSVIEHAAVPEPGLLRAPLGFEDYPSGAVPDDPRWEEVVELAVAVPELASSLVLHEEAGGLWTTADGIPVFLGPISDLADKGRVLLAVLGEEEVPDGWSLDLVAPRRPALVPPTLRQQAELRVDDPDDVPQLEDEASPTP